MRRRRRGAALVEFALVLPVLMLLLLGVIELGLIVNTWMMLMNGANVGARMAAIGSSVDAIRTATISATRQNVPPSAVLVEYCTNPAGTEDTNWSAAGNSSDGRHNAAPAGAMVRVRIKNFQHAMVTGSFFMTGSLPMSVIAVQRREKDQ
jgi:Flp pilus assembly protein TadG